MLRRLINKGKEKIGQLQFLKIKSLKAKLLLGFSTIIIFFIAFGIYNSISLNKIDQKAESIIDRELPSLLLYEKLQINISEQISLTRAYVLFGYPAYIERFNELSEEIEELEKEALQVADTKAMQDLIDRRAVLERFIGKSIIEVYDGGGEETAKENLITMNTQADRIITGYYDIVEEREATITKEGEELLSQSRSSFIVGIVITIIVTITGLIIALFVANIISNPIKRVSERMKLIARGDLSMEPLVSRSRDEVGQLVDASNQMNIDLKDLLSEINKLSHVVLLQGERLTQATTEVKEGSDQIVTTMEEVASGAEHQANTTNDLSASMALFMEKIRLGNETAEESYHSSQVLLTLTNEGHELMNSSIKQMESIDEIVMDSVVKVKKLDQHSQAITKLVGVINGIADQTNLLALNATIEAARAGEHGKGFAVVADEVRKLSEQVSLSVNDITQIVSAIQGETDIVTASLENGYQEVEEGTNEILATGEKFTSIHDSLLNMAKQIQKNSEELKSILEDGHVMNQSIEEIAALFEQAAAGIEETSANAHEAGRSMDEMADNSQELTTLTGRLNELIAKFKL